MPDSKIDMAIVKVKIRLSAVRELRDGLVDLAFLLIEERERDGYLLLIDPQLSTRILDNEMDRFKTALRPAIAHRLQLIAVRDGKVDEQPRTIPGSDWKVLSKLIEKSKDGGTRLPDPAMKEEVFLFILCQWVLGKGPMTSRWIADTVGCNYRTVSAAVDLLGQAILRSSDRQIELKDFPGEAWRRSLAVAHKTRTTMLYTDVSDQPRSPESLLKRLERLGLPDVAVGGVIGARRYYGELDVVGAPRLDLCVHVPGKFVDLDFVQKLDPALERTRDPYRPVRLALHFIRRNESLFDRTEKSLALADPVECLLHLYEARLDHQAESFAKYLAMRGRGLSD